MSEKKPFLRKALTLLQFLGIYFISLVMIAFATSKFFDAQFQIYNFSGYVPLKDTPLMTHAWSFFGRSYNYNLFLGIIEFIAGVLILFRKTRLVGLLLGFGVYLNILIIDIEFHVYDALGHVIVEFIIILLLLIPYIKDLKKFFWDMGGRFSEAKTTTSRFWSLYFPIGFIAILTIGFIIELKMALGSEDPMKGSYVIRSFIINNDTLVLKGGKHTREPMLFIEFGETLIISANDSTKWAGYTTHKDSILIEFDKHFEGFKTFNGIIDRKAERITGKVDGSLPFELNYSRVKK